MQVNGHELRKGCSVGLQYSFSSTGMCPTWASDQSSFKHHMGKCRKGHHGTCNQHKCWLGIRRRNLSPVYYYFRLSSHMLLIFSNNFLKAAEQRFSTVTSTVIIFSHKYSLCNSVASKTTTVVGNCHHFEWHLQIWLCSVTSWKEIEL